MLNEIPVGIIPVSSFQQPEFGQILNKKLMVATKGIFIMRMKKNTPSLRMQLLFSFL